MKLYIIWKYPDEEVTNAKTYFDVDPESIAIRLGMLFFTVKGDDEGITLSYKLTHIVEMRTEEDAEQSHVFAVGYDCGNGIFSTNMIEGKASVVEEYAKAYAKRYGYSFSYMTPVTEYVMRENLAKGMPFTKL